jgi:hypothetical protein
VKIRGSASQIFEKYQALARDASSSGDYIAAENFYQHAEHYFRMLAASAAAANGAGAHGAPNGAVGEAAPAGGGGRPQSAPGPNGASRPGGMRGRRNVGSVRPNGEAAPPPDPGAGPQPVIALPESDQPQSEPQPSDTAGS